MKAARIHKPGEIVIEEVPKPSLKETEVLIKVHRVGICGTDVAIKNGFIPAKFPVTLGHEFSGTIAELGRPGLMDLQVGDTVTSGSAWGCGECDFCQTDRDVYCQNRTLLGKNADGCMAEYVKVDSRLVQKLPPNVTLDEGQNMLNIACVLRAFKKVPLQLGKTVAVFGPGNSGLIMLQVLKMAGAYEAVVVGTRDFRLEMAKMFGANHVVNVKRQDPVEAILKSYPDGIDTAVEAAGTTNSFQSSCRVLKAGGSLIAFGLFSERIKDLDLTFLYEREVTIYGSKGSAGAKEDAIKLLEEKRLKVIPMITHRFPLEEAAQAFRVFEDKVPNALRILIEVAA